MKDPRTNEQKEEARMNEIANIDAILCKIHPPEYTKMVKDRRKQLIMKYPGWDKEAK